ncbi:MAG: hypothetical protein QOD66_2731, partial [Solirubrobacteraceae bacterium]|nr:hypothetical protein [Solirubrobacteraceae bacterium]
KTQQVAGDERHGSARRQRELGTSGLGGELD